MSGPTNGSLNGYEDSPSKKHKLLEERFECPICLACLKDPILTSCGHRFCKECIHRWLRQKGSQCPIDGQELSLEVDLFPDNYTRREIIDVVVECPDCGKKLPLLETENHILESHEGTDSKLNSEVIHCTFKNVGCESVFKTTSQMLAHSQSDINHHLNLLSNAHKTLSLKFEKSQIDNKAAEAEMWTPPSKQNDFKDNENELLLKSLSERIVLMEQTNKEQQIYIETLKEKVEILTKNLKAENELSIKLKDQVEALNTQNLKLKLELPLRICNGTHTWNIKSMSQKLSIMTRDHTQMYYSDGFYTSYSGYRFCARLNVSPNDPQYISILTHIMRGENDHALSWPFSGRIAITVIHPTKPELSIREVMYSRPELEAFKRPNKSMCMRGFGYSEFMLITDLINQGFLNYDDSVNIKIDIACV